MEMVSWIIVKLVYINFFRVNLYESCIELFYLFKVKNWILPADFDHAEAEARHLIYEADSDADQKLTKEEILEKYDIFVGSQATDFGEALTRHDEF